MTSFYTVDTSDLARVQNQVALNSADELNERLSADFKRPMQEKTVEYTLPSGTITVTLGVETPLEERTMRVSIATIEGIALQVCPEHGFHVVPAAVAISEGNKPLNFMATKLEADYAPNEGENLDSARDRVQQFVANFNAANQQGFYWRVEAEAEMVDHMHLADGTHIDATRV